MKRNFLSLFFMISFLLACGNESKQNYLQEISKMETTLDSLHVIAFNTSSNEMSQDDLIISVQETLQDLKQNYNSDTVDYELAKKLDAYKEIESALSINSGNLAKTKQAIEDTQVKVAELKHDIKKGVNDRNLYQDFIDFEKAKISEIENILDYYLEKHAEYQLRYDTLHPAVQELVKQLEIKNHE